jgi:hypothetical protein
MAAITSALTEPLVPETAEYFFDISMVSWTGHQKEAIGIFFIILAIFSGVGQILGPKNVEMTVYQKSAHANLFI